MPNVLTIPAHEPFLDKLASGLLEERPERLADTLMLLPSRRACLAMRESFLRVGEGRPLLLPRMRPVAEADEDGLLLDPAIGLDIPPAVALLRRRLLLARLILARGEITHEHALRLAGELAAFIDEVATERVSLDRLADLVPADLAEHWQAVLAFLGLLHELWPRVLDEQGVVDPAERRNRLLAATVRAWRSSPPPHPVLAAGITGSVPAVAELLAVVARLPGGGVVLPGLDLDQALEVAGELAPTHPQHMLMRLLEAMEVAPGTVRPWPGCTRSVPRVRLWRAVMQPAVSTMAWLESPSVEPAALAGIELVEASDVGQEALQIAIRLRAALETPGRRAILVTPDRGLGRRVAAELERWDIAVGDSAGVPLDQSPPGSFLLLCAHLLAEDAPPLPLLAALKHPLATGGMNQRDFRRLVRALERAVLRGPRPGGGLAGLVEAIDAAARERWSAPVPAGELRDWATGLIERARPFALLRGGGDAAAPFGDLLDAHLAFAIWLASDETGADAELWAREAGRVLHGFVAELSDAAALAGEVPVAAYPALLAIAMAEVAVRPVEAGHPRLAILGQLESRLAGADLVILGGLNEETWPAATEAGPWLSRGMRKALGLPPVEQRIGIAAHDFVQLACAPEVVLTRSRKAEAGAPTTPSRWLFRLRACLKAQGLAEALAPDSAIAQAATTLDRPLGPAVPERRPRPCPPAAARPRELSVSDIETLMRDPYALYARKVLRLAALDPIDASPGGAERGNIVHRALARFVEATRDGLPKDALALLEEVGRTEFALYRHLPQVETLWLPRYREAARWIADRELARRVILRELRGEIAGELLVAGTRGTHRIRARADRIELGRDARITIVDYKTGGLPEVRDVVQGYSPQLPLEALIATRGGFAGLPEAEVAEILYWQLKGGLPPGEERAAQGKGKALPELLAETEAGLARLLDHFADEATPYLAIPRPEVAPNFSDFEHLARVAEWRGSVEPGD